MKEEEKYQNNALVDRICIIDSGMIAEQALLTQFCNVKFADSFITHGFRLYAKLASVCHIEIQFLFIIQMLSSVLFRKSDFSFRPMFFVFKKSAFGFWGLSFMLPFP